MDPSYLLLSSLLSWIHHWLVPLLFSIDLDLTKNEQKRDGKNQLLWDMIYYVSIGMYRWSTWATDQCFLIYNNICET